MPIDKNDPELQAMLDEVRQEVRAEMTPPPLRDRIRAWVRARFTFTNIGDGTIFLAIAAALTAVIVFAFTEIIGAAFTVAIDLALFAVVFFGCATLALATHYIVQKVRNSDCFERYNATTEAAAIRARLGTSGERPGDASAVAAQYRANVLAVAIMIGVAVAGFIGFAFWLEMGGVR